MGAHPFQSPTAIVFLGLLSAHLLGDFVLQTDRDVQRKDELRVLLRHALMHAILAYLLVGAWRLWWLFAALGLLHFGIDWLKLKLAEKVQAPLLFMADQMGHLGTLILATWLSLALNPGTFYWLNRFGPETAQALILTSGLILTVTVGSVIAGFLVKPFLQQMEDMRGLEKGGKYIGQLERGIIFFFVMVGKPEAVGFLVAAKSIFRIGEREKRKEAEYFLIGTLFSFGWGLLFAWTTKQLLGAG